MVNENNNKKKPLIPGWLKTLFAAGISAAIVYYYFKNVDWQELIQATKDADLVLAFFAVLIPQIIFWLFTVYQYDRTFTWFHKPFPWLKYVWVRGGLYLVMMVNVALGGGSSVLYLQRKTQISWYKFIGISTLRIGMQLASVGMVLIVVTAAMQMNGAFEKTPINPYLWWTILILGQLLFIDTIAYFLYGKELMGARWFFTTGEKNGRLIGGIRNRDHEIWYAFREAKTYQWLAMLSWGIVQLVSMIIGFWLFAYAFNVHIPFLFFAGTIAFVFLIQDTPLAFAGFGTTTLAWTLFYSDYGSAAAIGSLTLAMPVMRLLIRAGIGVVALRPALSDISELIRDQRKAA